MTIEKTTAGMARQRFTPAWFWTWVTAVGGAGKLDRARDRDAADGRRCPAEPYTCDAHRFRQRRGHLTPKDNVDAVWRGQLTR